MRNLPALLEAELAGAAYGICRLIEITRQNGTVLRIAEAQTDLTVDGETFVKGRGFRVSSMPFVANAMSASLDFEIVAIDGGSIDPDDLRNGHYDAAEVTIYAASHLLPENGSVTLFKGQVGNIDLTDVGLARVTVLGLLSKARELVIEHYTPVCRAFLGDHRCRVDLGPWTQPATVVSVSGLTVNISGAAAGQATDWYKLGLIVPTSGPSLGDAFEIRGSAGAALQTYLPCQGKLNPGDAVNIITGCDFTRGPLGCNRYDNILNMRAEPYCPGQNATDVTYSDWGET